MKHTCEGYLAVHHGQPVSLAILDIDHFKRVNLTGGSVPDGDSALQSWLEAAGQALLKAKQARRDRVEVT